MPFWKRIATWLGMSKSRMYATDRKMPRHIMDRLTKFAAAINGVDQFA
jgi:hypothetical protein